MVMQFGSTTVEVIGLDDRGGGGGGDGGAQCRATE
jgi:hypothetical protein